MRRALAPAVILTLSLLPATGCTMKKTTTFKCQGSAVAPNAQPGSKTAPAALDWFLEHLAGSYGVPTSGYRKESSDRQSIVYAARSGRDHIWVGNFGTAAKPSFAVQRASSC